MPAYETVWIVGDDFVSDSVGEFFQSDETLNKSYLQDKYDIKILCSSSLSATDTVEARVHNNVLAGMADQPLLSKAIIIVLDSDVIKTINYNKKGVSEIYNKSIKNLLTGIHRVILSHKEALPSRSKRPNYPTVLYAMMPQHINFPSNWNLHRRLFNEGLEIAVQSFNKMTILKLLKIWDSRNVSYVDDNHKFTADGLSAVWASIDSAFRHWDTFVYTRGKNKLKTAKTANFSKSAGEFVRMEHRRYKLQKSNAKKHWGQNFV